MDEGEIPRIRYNCMVVVLSHLCHKWLMTQDTMLTRIPSGFRSCYGDIFEVAYVSLS